MLTESVLCLLSKHIVYPALSSYKDLYSHARLTAHALESIAILLAARPELSMIPPFHVSSQRSQVAKAMTSAYWVPQGVIRMLGRSRSLLPVVPRRADRATRWAHH